MEHAERTSLAFDPFLDEGWDDQEERVQAPARPDVESNWFKRFETEHYDWNDPLWKKQIERGKHSVRFIPIMMRRPGSKKRHDVVPSGYVMAVSPADYRLLTRFPDGSPKRWTLKVDRDQKTGRILKMYARRCGRGEEPRCVLAHREILGCIFSKHVVDHYNGWGLDNRRANLGHVRRSENNSNARRARSDGLPCGVEMRMTKDGPRYRGIRAQRVPGRKHAKIFRSKRSWKTPEPAAKWYENQVKRRHGIRPWARNPTSVSYPLFPPRLESEPYEKSRSLRKKQKEQSRRERELAEIPF